MAEGCVSTVAPIELFFYLVFVFAVSQLSHHLIEHLSLRSLAETLVMLVAVLTVWSYTSWAATMIPVYRASAAWMMLVVMLLGLIMNASISKAFGLAAWGLVAPMLMIQIGRTIWTIFNASDAAFKEHFIRALIWLVLTAPLWVIGAMSEPHDRLWWWASAAAIELIGTWLAHPVPGKRLKSENIPFNADHMLERCNLFLIIALGETVLTTGISISASPTNLMTLLTGTCALIGTIALWAMAFGSAQRHTLHHAEVTVDPVRVSRHAMNAITIMVAGLIAVAVAGEKIVHHPSGHVSLMVGMLLTMGPALFLIAQSWYLQSILKIRSHTHSVAALVIAPIGLLVLMLPPYGVIVISGLILALVAAYDWSSSVKT